MIRFFKNEVIPNLKSLSIAWKSFNDLSEYEKANLKRATMELMLSCVILPSIGLLLAGAASGGGDDDDKALWFAIYMNRRLTQELRQFWNPLDTAKLINNPVAASRFINNGLDFAYDVISPLNFTPKDNENVFGYLDENSKGDNKMLNHFNKLIPISSQFKDPNGFLGKNYQQMFGLQYGR